MPAHMQVVRGNKLKSQLLDKVDPYVTVEVGGWTCAACDSISVWGVQEQKSGLV